MIRNNFKICWRHLIKDRQFTVLNVLGLSAGLACALLIYLWVHDELSVDKFFKKNSQIYQLMELRKSDGEIKLSDESSGLLNEVLKAQEPEIEYATAVAPPEWWQKFTLTAGDKNIKAIGQYAGKDYFNIFSFNLLEGSPGRVLADKTSIVISDELARKLFNTTENIIGKVVRFQQEKDFFVSGVFEKVPDHSSQQFDFVLSFDYLFEVQQWVKTWISTGPHNFVLLKQGTDVAALNRRIANAVLANSGDSTRSVAAMLFADNYVHHTFDHGSRVGGRMQYVRLFSIIAAFILGIACINFMNLSTARASKRLKEVGIKKVVGAGRRQLIAQFLMESLLLTAFAMILAVGFALIILPAFNALTGKSISAAFDLTLILRLIGITIFTGLLSGSYPALYLSGFNPISILKGKLQASMGEIFSRKGLVIFQFSISVMLIISVLVVSRQVQFIQGTDPGYRKDNVVRFNSEGRIRKNVEPFMADLKKIPGVLNASFTFNNMVGRNFGHSGLDWDGKDPNENIYFEGFGGSYDFIETMGMQIKEGRSFSKNYGAENSKIILNEAAIRVMHLKDPVGKTIKMFDNPAQIIGIIKDFHFESLHEAVKPMYMTLVDGVDNPWFKIMVRIKGGQERQTIARIQKFYESFNPGFPFDFNFLDEAYQKQYQTETRAGTLSRYFAGLAIIISCLGLFGLATFTAQRRQKEIGIRKVIGASVAQIATMLSGDFLKLVLIAVLIAFPVAWWAMNQWLNGFAYRIHMGIDVFVIAGISAVAITVFTIGFQTVRAALANPSRSLKSE